MDFFKYRGHSPETHRLRQDRSKILQPNKTRIVGKGREKERIQEYRPSQEGRKQTEKINIMIFNRCFQNSETLGSTPLKEFQENVNEALLNPSSDSESKINQLKQEKWPTKVLRIFRKHEGVYLFRLKQTAKQNTLQKVQNEKTSEAIKCAEKYVSMDLSLLVGETVRDTKIQDAIIVIERGRSDNILYPYRQHMTTRFGKLFYNDKIIIPGAMRSTLIAMLHRRYVSVNKMDQSAEAFCWPGMHRENREGPKLLQL